MSPMSWSAGGRRREARKTNQRINETTKQRDDETTKQRDNETTNDSLSIKDEALIWLSSVR